MVARKECLVLIVDADPSWCGRISEHLMERQYKTALAQNSLQAIEMIGHLHPQVIVCDLDLPGNDATSVLENASRGPFPIPAIMTTARLTYESPEIASALKKGAFDCLIKPFTVELLTRKIEQTIQVDTQAHEHGLLNDFSVFFNRISSLNATSDPETLLDISFDYFIQISGADSATLHLFNREKNTWRKVREKSDTACAADDAALDDIINEMTGTDLPVLEERKKIELKTHDIDETAAPTTSLMAVPLRTGNEIRGIVVLQRSGRRAPFSQDNLQAAEIVALQVGNALINAHLYETVNRKLLELQIVSSYSEKLMGMVDKYDVIRALFETTVRHFEVDFIGFLIVQRRTHEFLYWSRYAVDEKVLEEFGSETIAVFNRAAETGARRRRNVYHAVKLDGQPGDPMRLPSLVFRYVVPLCWEDLRFGAVFFGAVAEPDQASGKLALLSSIVGQTRIALTNTKLYGDMKENYIRTIKALAIAVDAKDTYTHGHSENVMNIAEEIARELSIDEKTIGSIRDAGLLHDIGKIGIPGYILNKPGPLTYEEFNGIMKTHSTLGANIVRDVPFLRDLHKLILYHHEHYDGKGYPEGLKGEQIPMGARILHVADAFEAMTSNRPYRNSLGRTEAIRRLIEGSGKQFDPSIIAAFLQLAGRKNWLTDHAAGTALPLTP
ncbi:MAG: HD domain-containing protein [Chitinispirillaceae bacterium]|nr:HD domain-containing protein [Chitinispirillaceae bacterium]